jgi:hypothetical protein
MATFATDVEISQTLPGSPEARAVLTDYFRDLVNDGWADLWFSKSLA